jgi:hypothetical protein
MRSVAGPPTKGHTQREGIFLADHPPDGTSRRIDVGLRLVRRRGYESRDWLVDLSLVEPRNIRIGVVARRNRS